MKNLFIFIADSLRYDHLPDSIRNEGSEVRALAPSLHTPVSLSSLVTGRSPEKHNVRGFDYTLRDDYETVFDRFENGCFYDNEKDPIRHTVLKHTPEAKEIEELEEPFVFIERAMDSHLPYGDISHGNELGTHIGEPSANARNYADVKEAYREGVRSVEEHFWNHVEELEERGLREETLIVFASDHGELLADRVNLRKRYAHAHPMSRELVEVPIVFLDQKIDAESGRFIDIINTSLGILEKEKMDVESHDLRTGDETKGVSLIDGYTSFKNTWLYDGFWKPQSSFKLSKDILREDLRMLFHKFLDKDIFARPGSFEENFEEKFESIDF